MRQTTTEAVSLFPNFHVKQLVSSQIKCALMLLLIKIWKKVLSEKQQKKQKIQSTPAESFSIISRCGLCLLWEPFVCLHSSPLATRNLYCTNKARSI